MSIREDQETYSKYIQYAYYSAEKQDFDTARRALVCAAGMLSKIATEASKDVRQEFAKKYSQLVRECVTIKNDSLINLISKISREHMGCDIDPVVNRVYVEAELKPEGFDQVAGLEEAKEVIRRQIINPAIYPDIYSRYRKKLGGGFLLYGLPGTGKTMIARAVANEIDAEFYPIKCSDILDKWFGESSKRIKELYDEAKSHRLSIIFFDEFDALGVNRSGDENCQAACRVVTELLAQMQGIEQCSNVITICATNRPWDVDAAFLRPGRLNKQIYVPLPDADAREVIISNAFKGVPIDKSIDFTKIVKLTDGYSGADVHELCEIAKTNAIDREIESGKKGSILAEDIDAALREVHSSIRHTDQVEMDQYRKNLGYKIA